MVFQSLIGILADCNDAVEGLASQSNVSIPNRDFSWLQFHKDKNSTDEFLFQSLIGILADCNQSYQHHVHTKR